MPTQKTQAIVIRAFPLREAHKIITFYTPDFGKVKTMAYGVKSPKSKLSGSLELLNHGMLLFNYRENRDLQSLTGFDLIEGFDGIRTDFERITYGCYLAELVDAIASEGDANPEIFDLLRRTYQFLTDTDDVVLLARIFEIKFLDLAGYAPQLSQCANCGAVVTASPAKNTQGATMMFFSVRHGGLLCGDCQHRDTSAFSIAPGSCELLKTLRKSELGKLSRIRASTRNHRELKLVLSSFIQYHTERNLKSLKFIESVLEV
ncbi:MAG: DNA repair protein RecO [Candidatus Poribacteria bacterium]|nr:DNA repair protein RecO [Candidatus Poribacteria bacterium]